MLGRPAVLIALGLGPRPFLSYPARVWRAANFHATERPLFGAVRVVLAFVMFALVACDESPTAPTVGLNREFVLAPGETAKVADTGIRIRFVGVLGDSRCPADAVCILGGDAIVRIEVLSFGGGLHEYDLHTGDLRPVVHEGFTIGLVNLMPYPFSSKTIQPNEFRATLRVTP